MQIEQTQDYNLFKRLPGNRQYNKPHLARLKESISNEPTLSRFQPILVNENFEIIDGQHRLEVMQALNLPVYYVKADGLRLGDVQTLNTLSKSWTPIDYAKSYVELGNKNYQIYLDMKSKYHFNHQILLAYLNLSPGRDSGPEFLKGEFKVIDLPHSVKLLDQLVEMGVYYPRYSARPFAMAYLRIAMHPDYNHARMISKMKYRGSKIEDYSLVEDYQRALEAVYNWRMSTDRVRFF